jgi:hypothetical protein
MEIIEICKRQSYPGAPSHEEVWGETEVDTFTPCSYPATETWNALDIRLRLVKTRSACCEEENMSLSCWESNMVVQPAVIFCQRFNNKVCDIPVPISVQSTILLCKKLPYLFVEGSQRRELKQEKKNTTLKTRDNI